MLVDPDTIGDARDRRGKEAADSRMKTRDDLGICSFSMLRKDKRQKGGHEWSIREREKAMKIESLLNTPTLPNNIQSTLCLFTHTQSWVQRF
jgi:hypothetical protein